METSEVKLTAIKSVKWTSLGEIVSHSLQPLVMLILARLLTPEDFGVVGVAMITIGLAQILQDFGLGKTLIQRETEIDKSAIIVFWTNLILSILIYLTLFISAPLISNIFHDNRVTNVLRVLCLQIVLTSLITVHQALFQRDFQFKQLFFIRLFSALIPGFVSIPMALTGHGVWSLVFGTLAGATVQVFLFLKSSPWRPNLSYDFQHAKKLFGFSSWVTLEALLSWLIMWGDSIVLGYFLGVKELGVYRVGVTSLMLIFGIFFNPILPVAYSAFSRLQSDHEELRQSFLTMNKLIASISLPLGIGLAVLAQPISLLLFGQKWEGMEIVIIFIGMVNTIAWLIGINPEVYRAMGRPDAETKLLVVAIIYYLPVYILAAPYGLFVFCVARLTIAIVSMGLHIFVANKLLRLPFTYLGSCIKLPLLGSLIMAAVVYLLTSLTGSFSEIQNGIKLIGIIAIAGLTYIVALWFLKKDFVIQFWRLAREGIK